jgi:hypothetical protein
MIWDKIKKVAKESGEKLIGRGAEVKFRKEVQEHMSRFGTSKEDAEKEILDDQFGFIDSDITADGTIDGDKKEWRALEAGVNETLSKTAKEKCLEDSGNTSIFRSFRTPRRGDKRKLTKFLSKKHKDAYPDRDLSLRKNDALITGMANQAAYMQQLMDRLRRELTPHMGTGASLESILTANPQIGADLGQLQKMKGVMDKSDSILLRKMGFDRSMENLKDDFHKAVTEDLLKGTKRFLGLTIGGVGKMFRGDFSGFAKYMTEGTGILMKGFGRVGSLGAKTLKTCSLYLNSKRK